jgi:hypothetical protein
MIKAGQGRKGELRVGVIGVNRGLFDRVGGVERS